MLASVAMLAGETVAGVLGAADADETMADAEAEALGSVRGAVEAAEDTTLEVALTKSPVKISFSIGPSAKRDT